MVHHGGQRHLYYLNPEQREYVIKVDWISQPFNIVCLATGKVSVALLLLRLLGPSAFWRKWFLYISIVLTLVFGILTAIFTFVQCNPVRTLWEGPLKNPHAKCWNPTSQLAFSLFSSSKSNLLSTRVWVLYLTFSKVGMQLLILLWLYYRSH